MNLYPNETWVRNGIANKTWAGFRIIPQIYAQQAAKNGCQILCKIQQDKAKMENATNGIRSFEKVEPIFLWLAIFLLMIVIVLYCFIILYERFEFDSMKRGFTNQVKFIIRAFAPPSAAGFPSDARLWGLIRDSK